jgi:hypothetical protein
MEKDVRNLELLKRKNLELLKKRREEFEMMKKDLLMSFKEVVNECTTKRELVYIKEILKKEGIVNE